MNSNTLFKLLKNQFDEMLKNGIIPVIEYKLADDDYLVVSIDICEKGITFVFDDELKCSFSGNVISNGDYYLIKFDDCFCSLDHYLQTIDQEMIEGYLIPNNILHDE